LNRGPFRSQFSEDIFVNKYAHEGCETWEQLSHTLVNDVCKGLLPVDVCKDIEKAIADMKFIPGGRYLYYAGRKNKYYNNCYLLRSEEDSRDDWANLSWKVEHCLMTGGGIGNDYSKYRGKGEVIKGTGGLASGPVSKATMINEIGRRVMQGGARRSALYASLNWLHPDARRLIFAKDWDLMEVAGTSGLSIGDLKRANFNYAAPLDMTNVSLNYDDNWLNLYEPTKDAIYLENVRHALMLGDPGFSFNFGERENETLRNACTEVVSSDDSDVCNLGSLNLSRIDNIADLECITELAIAFLLCGTIRADLPYPKIYQVREKNRRLGLGLMGMHEWLLMKGYRYECVPELSDWLHSYASISDSAALYWSNYLSCSLPVATRAIAPTGTIGIMAGTTTGIEPIFAVAYRRRYLKGKKEWHYQYVVEDVAERLIQKTGIHPDDIETALSLADDVERRICFQADVQDHIDMGVSSTINLPEWGSNLNNEDLVEKYAETIHKYSLRLRGLTVYPDGARGGQPLAVVPYHSAKSRLGQEYKATSHDICEITGKGGVCGI